MQLFFLVPPLLGLPSSSPDTLSSQPDLSEPSWNPAKDADPSWNAVRDADPNWNVDLRSDPNWGWSCVVNDEVKSTARAATRSWRSRGVRSNDA